MLLASMSYYSCYKLFCNSIVTNSHQNEILIPQLVAFHQTRILQSGEFSLITFNLRKIRFSIQIQSPQIVGFRCTKNIQSGEFLVLTYNLRNNQFSFQIPQVVGLRCTKKPIKCGILYDFHQSEEYSEFHSTLDSSDCSVSNMTKATNWGSLKNVSLALMSYHS